MSLKLRISLMACLLTLLAPAFAQAGARDSLYDARTAQKLDSAKLSMFGPQAGKFRYDKRMIQAAEIASARARKHSTSRCWRYVKDALVASNIIQTRPNTANAKEAAGELTQEYGFEKIRERNPYKAPLGSVIVYGGRGAGHVEIRTARGFVSDFVSEHPSPRPLIGIYIKPRA
jgi:hypothetical protein